MFYFFLMTSVTHDAPLGKNLLRAAMLQTFSAYCYLTEVTPKRGKSSWLHIIKQIHDFTRNVLGHIHLLLCVAGITQGSQMSS